MVGSQKGCTVYIEWSDIYTEPGFRRFKSAEWVSEDGYLDLPSLFRIWRMEKKSQPVLSAQSKNRLVSML